MGKVFRPSNRESKILSKIESSKEYARRRAIQKIPDVLDALSNALAQKLVETGLLETTSKNGVEAAISKRLEKLTREDDFDVDFKVAPFRKLVAQPHVVSLYMTAFVVEDLINHKDVVDIFGDDLDIYKCVHKQIIKHLS
ncbi:hypothetical protein SAMN02745216_00107 [Desulfatibacillum alkenivorans DSM 16219]|jgi:hypothetical protein|uniref:Uncharacterized protein n=1 Tax=Desulfatibacillum alkenivorans DSM 16219 TaxID=1121393 RepID=A0A1M6BYU7_9BACT|nr:hypothetical protein [Desulfatibacillum alkenivorans]SHI53975.1 hypothetical protein SAMN02745216_00107 [Desulfatibacillum alkenivorans DSM 16219]